MPSIKDTFLTALTPLKGRKNLLFFLVISLISAFISFIFTFIFKYMYDLTLINSSSVLYLILSLVLLLLFLFIWSYLYCFLYKYSAQLIFYSAASWREVLKVSLRVTPKFMLTSLLYILLIIAGVILLVFPALIWGVRNFFAPISSAIESDTPRNAFSKSRQYVKGAFWKIFLRIFIFSLIYNIPGTILNTYLPDFVFLQSLFLPLLVLLYVSLYKGAREKQIAKKVNIDTQYTNDLNKYTV